MHKYFSKKSLLFIGVFLAILSFKKPLLKLERNIKLFEKGIYFGAGCAFGVSSIVSQFIWGLSVCFSDTLSNECLLFSHLSRSLSNRFFYQVRHGTHHKKQKTLSSWNFNEEALSQISTSTEEERRLLLFLKNRWLVKSNGFSSKTIDWIYPCFGFFLQIHPKTSFCYSRDPSLGLSDTYTDIVNQWKKTLPHPKTYPLILTRPFDLQKYLPHYIRAFEEIPQTFDFVLKQDRTIVDMTHLLPEDPKQWQSFWKKYESSFLKFCKKHNIHLENILFVQKVQRESIGGLRLLPLSSLSKEQVEIQHNFLLKWIGSFGLSANPIELDRWLFDNHFQAEQMELYDIPLKEKCIQNLENFEKGKFFLNSQKAMILRAELKMIKGLISKVSEDQWAQIMCSSTKSKIIQFSFSEIEKQLHFLQQKERAFFLDFTHLEKIHYYLCNLLEIFSPFDSSDFFEIYQNLLPEDFKKHTSYAVHSSGMTSFRGVFTALENALGPFRVIYGKNIYYECENIATKGVNASASEKATDEDFEQTDVLLVQFDPVWKIVFEKDQYKVENISDLLHKIFTKKREKPLVLVIDSTFDFINSKRNHLLLKEFQEQIEKGMLNIICYRSGIKFDLLGMDNFFGAPFLMIHNKDPKWDYFDFLLKDPLLQTDKLSMNWFCLAYQYAASELELYRKQTFENTKKLLNRLPQRLYEKGSPYQVISFEKEAHSVFVDIKVKGFLHSIRAAGLVGGTLFMMCMENGYPIFTRHSLGFYHPNFGLIFDKDLTTIRLTVGIDPEVIETFVKCFGIIDTLNGCSNKEFLEKIRDL